MSPRSPSSLFPVGLIVDCYESCWTIVKPKCPYEVEDKISLQKF